MAKYYDVDYYMLNASLDTKGDSAIALLVLKDPAVTKPIGTIKSAVLIDGGNGVKTASLIVKAIGKIQSNYTDYAPGATPPVYFKFDAIVITHWDEDHYRGFLHLLSKPLWTGDQFNHFKYNVTTGAPMTYLYCASVDYPSPKKGTAFFGDEISARLRKSAPSGPNISWDVQIQVNKVVVVHPRTIAGAAGANNLLGVNVFTGLGIQNGKSWDKISNPLDLVNANDPYKAGTNGIWNGAPGLYIVGVDSDYLGNMTPDVPAPPPAAHRSLADLTSRGGDGLGVINIKPTPKNASSIMVLLIWKNTTSPETIPPLIQFYSGGDAEWTGENKTANFVKPSKIQVIKLGHHGSAAATSTYFVETVIPERFLISNGTEHGHPVPDVLFYIDSFRPYFFIPNPQKRIYSVCYPYHLGYVEENGKTRYFSNRLTNPDLLTTNVSLLSTQGKLTQPNEKLYPDFIKLLQASYAKLGKSPVTDFTNLVNQILAIPNPILKNAQDAYIAKKSKPNKKALEDAKLSLAITKSQVLAPILARIWKTWSTIDYRRFPLRAFDMDGVAPKTLIVIDWVYATFSCPSSFQSLATEMQAIEEEQEVKPPTEPPAKKVKLNADDELIARRAVDRLRGGTKRARSPRPDTDRNLFTMSTEDETVVQEQECDDDSEMLPNGALDPDLPSYFYELPSASLEVPGHQISRIDISVAPTKVYPSDGPTGNNFINLVDASNSDYFVAGLEGSSLSLTAQLTSGGAWEGSLQNDILLSWLEAFFVVPATNVAMIWSGILASPYNLEAQIKFNLPGSAGAVGVTYNSQWSAIAAAFDILGNQQLVDELGFFNPYTGLVLGLEPIEGIAMTTKQVFQLLEMSPFPFVDPNAVLGFKEGTGSGSSNGIWICPEENYSVTWRMTLQGATDKASQAYLCFPLPGLTFNNSVIVATKQAYLYNGLVDDTTQAYMMPSGSISIQADAVLNGNPSSIWSTFINLSDNAIGLRFRWTSVGSGPLADLFAWLANSGPQISIQSAYENFKSVLDNLDFRLREFSIIAEHDSSGWHFSSCAVVFELDLAWGVSDPDTMRVPVRLSLSCNAGSVPSIGFNGRIWQTTIDNDLERLIPGSLPYPTLSPNSTLAMVPYFSLLGMKGVPSYVQNNFPSTVIPTNITALELTVNNDGISFNGLMTPGGDAAPDSWLSFDSVSISASYTQAFTQLECSFSAQISLYPRTDSPANMAVLEVDIGYDSASGWVFEGIGRDLNLGCLYSLFPNAESNAVMNVLEDIIISYFNITYKYRGVANSFTAEGIIQLGDTITLDLEFNSGSEAHSDSGWEFSAALSMDSPTTDTTLGSILEGISSGLSSDVPAFINGITFSVEAESTISLECKKVNSNDNKDGYILLGIVAHLFGFSFSLVQITSMVPTEDGSISEATKTLLKFTLDTLPSVASVPLLDSLTQPFDSMSFLYVSDDFTRDEVAVVNSNVYDGTDQLIFKDPRLETNDPLIVVDPNDPLKDKVLRAGCHFQVVVELNNQPTPVLDYVFGVQQAPTTAFPTSRPGLRDDLPSTLINHSTVTAPWTKTLGPLTISAISLKCDGTNLEITLDVGVKLGPLAGRVKGFTLSIPLNKLPNLTGVSVSLEGIGLEMNRPPVSLAGEMMHNKDGSYTGGVSICVEPYIFLAGGYYNDSVPTNGISGGSFKSLFVFAQLDGPIAEFEFASLSGLQGGVGYNSQIILPTIDNLIDFPFLAPIPSSQTSILDILDSYLRLGTITPADGPCWIAAGLTVKAFQTLLIKAVVVVDLSDDIRFGIFADVLANIPASATNDSELFARLDMSLLAVADPAKGIFRAEGQLTPKSFILDQSCHLLGGFALCYWFEGSGHEGDWVFTVGGYHSAYTPSVWYPRPRRLAVSWQYDSDLSIHGEAYFAITPKVCMGGGALAFNYHSGNLQLDLNAYADFLINYRPFTFVADVGVELNIQYTIDFYIVTKKFNVHFGARLDLWGPPVAGVIHIEWSILTLDVWFGDSYQSPAQLTWTEFSSLLRQETGDAQNNTLLDQGLHSIAASSGVLTNSGSTSITIRSQTAEAILVNAATFSFMFTSLFPITSTTYTAGQVVGQSSPPHPTYIKPMQIRNTDTVKGDLTVIIRDSAGKDAKFFYQPVQKQVPTALWNAYDPTTDPSSGTTVTSLLSPTNATIAQTMSIKFLGPLPTDSADWLAFNIDLGSSVSVGTPTLPGPIDVPAAVMAPATFSATTNVWAPVTATSLPSFYSPCTVLGRLEMPLLASFDVVSSWIAFCDVALESPLAVALSGLQAETAKGAPAWVSEVCGEATAPLPLLSAEATLDALSGGADGSRYAGMDFSEGAPALNRDFLDGGYVGAF